LRRPLRIALATIKWLAIVGGAALVVVLLVNSRDEALTPEASSLAELQTSALPNAQNAYLVLIGFDAPPGVEPTAAGASLVAENNASAASDPVGWGRISKLAGKDASVEREAQLKFVGNLNALHDPLDGGCLPQALEHAHDIRSMIEANEVLVARYLAMQRLPAYANTSVPDILQSTPPAAGWIASRRLLLMRSCLDLQSGQVAGALEFLAADSDMWRRVLGYGALLDEMIAVRGLASDLKVLSDLIDVATFDVGANEAKLRQILAPLTAVELNMVSAFRREFELQVNLITELPKEVANDKTAGWIDRLTNGSLFFKPNATVNLTAKLFSGLLKIANSPPSEYVVLQGALQREIRAQSEPAISWIYNPIGRQLATLTVPSYADAEYVTRVFDLAAYANLVRAQLELRLAAIPPAQVPQFLTAAGPETQDPYTKLPFRWNASDNSLSFDPKSSRWREWSTKVVPKQSLLVK